MSVQPETRTDRRAEVEQAILDAAADLLADGSSFAALSVDAISRRAGIGRTAFYFYFRDKRAVLMRLAEDVAGRLYEEADRWWHGEDAMGDLRRSLEATTRLYMSHAPVLRVITEAATYDDEVRGFWNALVRRFIDATRERIERDGSPVPAQETAAALVWMAERTLYQLARDGDRGEAERVVEALTQVFARAVYGRLPGD